MTNQVEKKNSITTLMAEKFNMERDAFISTVKRTCFPKGEATNEQLAAFLLVAEEYDLNPFTKEIYAFPANGGIQPIVSVDGWSNLINTHPQCNGIAFEENLDDEGKCYSITCSIYRKDRDHPCVVTEYMNECVRATDTWKKWPIRMLRHKALIQCARVAFGFAGIYDEDEAYRIKDVTREPTGAKEINEQLAKESGIVIEHDPMPEVFNDEVPEECYADVPIEEQAQI